MVLISVRKSNCFLSTGADTMWIELDRGSTTVPCSLLCAADAQPYYITLHSYELRPRYKTVPVSS